MKNKINFSIDPGGKAYSTLTLVFSTGENVFTVKRSFFPKVDNFYFLMSQLFAEMSKNIKGEALFQEVEVIKKVLNKGIYGVGKCPFCTFTSKFSRSNIANHVRKIHPERYSKKEDFIMRLFTKYDLI